MLKFCYKSVILLSLVVIVGCAVGPDYIKPDTKQMEIPSHWHAKLPHNGNDMQMINWWAQFNDQTMVFFIQSALASNPSIFQAIAKVKQSQASLQGSNSFLFPSVTLNANAAVARNPSIPFNAGGIQPNGGATGDIFMNNGLTNSYGIGPNASWELDLFGANSRAIEASQYRYEASKSNWNDAKVSLIAQVANVYVSTRQCQNLLMIYEEEFKSRSATREITHLRVSTGFAPPSDDSQANGSFYQNDSKLQQQKGICEKYKNQLVALTGVDHELLETKLAKNWGAIPVPRSMTINNIPAKIISQRPDVSLAERNLAAANADLGVSMARRYPQVSLNGAISAQGGSLYGGQLGSWSLGPSISLPLFDGGYLKSQVELSKAKYEEVFAIYRAKVINAVNEVEDALVRIEASNKSIVAAKTAMDSYEAYFNAYNKKYQNGWVNLLDLETVRVMLLSSKEQYASAKYEQVDAWIALYRAVGGSWNESSVKMES